MRDFVWGGTGEGHNFHLVGFGDSEISSVQPRVTWEMVMALSVGKGTCSGGGVVIDNKYGASLSEFCVDAVRGPYGVCQFDSGIRFWCGDGIFKCTNLFKSSRH